MNQVELILVAWVGICLVGLFVNVWFLLGTIGDKQFLKLHNLNGVRAELVDIHFREAFSHMVVKLIFALLGIWSMALRAGNDTPLTLTGWVIFGTFFAVLLLMTGTDILNFKARMSLVERLMHEGIVFVPIPNATEDQEKTDAAMLKQEQSRISLDEKSTGVP